MAMASGGTIARGEPEPQGKAVALASSGAQAKEEAREEEEKAREEDEDSTGGLFSALQAVRASVSAAVLGARRPVQAEAKEEQRPEESEEAEAAGVGATAGAGAEEQAMLEFPSPEWLEPARGLSLSMLGESGSRQLAEAPSVARDDADSEDTAKATAGEAALATEATAVPDAPVAPAAASAAAPPPSAPVVVDLRKLPPPSVPGLDKADFVVRVEIDPQRADAVKMKEEGVARLMAQPGGEILATMAQSGWRVEPVEPDEGLYELVLPSVCYEVPGGRVSIPAPRFLTVIRNSFTRTGRYEERLAGDLVLQNGEDILTVELGFPFRKKFSVSAAGWARPIVGWEGASVLISNSVEIGFQLPKVPGLAPIMQYFVRSYGIEATKQCSVALAKGADSLPPGGAEWLASSIGAVAESWDSVLKTMPELPTPGGQHERLADTEARPAASDIGETAEAASPGPPKELVPSAIADVHRAGAAAEGIDTGLSADLLYRPREAPEGDAVEAEPSSSAAQAETDVEAAPAASSATVGDSLLEGMPPPTAPGFDEANLVVGVERCAKTAEAVETREEGVARLMKQTGGEILAAMAREGWTVEPVDLRRDLFELSLPAVRYELAGAVVSIPSPRFMTTVRDSCKRADDYEERLVGDLVLQNGKDILTVQLGFPFQQTFRISAAGWARACVGWEGSNISIANTVKVGLQLPQVPGLAPIMQYFVESYGSDATQQCVDALAKGADSLPPEPEWWTSARDAMSELSKLGQAAVSPTATAPALPGPSTTTSGQPGPIATPEAQRPAAAEASAPLVGDRQHLESLPPPTAPGMEEANLVVRAEVDPRSATAEETREEGVRRLMSRSGGAILATMAQEGWTVEPVDRSKGLYALSLPAVRYELPGGTVSMPAPRFLTTVRDSFQRTGDYEERLLGDLVLQNGQDILNVELGFPFRTTFNISASGWARARVGWEKDAISISCVVEIGLQLPKIPGLAPIMQHFVRSYGGDSTEQCSRALARGADSALADGGPEWLASGLDAVAERWESVLGAMPGVPEMPTEDGHLKNEQ